MLTKKDQRTRRSRQTRARIGVQRIARLMVHRTNTHIYATLVSEDGARVLASASTLEAEVRKDLLGDNDNDNKPGEKSKARGANAAAASLVGKRIAEKAKAAGVEKVAFDRSGFADHARVKALAEAARKAGLQF